MRARHFKKLALILAVLALALAAYVVAPAVIHDPAQLKTQRPQKTALMKLREVQAKHQGRAYRIDQRWVALSKISPSLREAVRVSEDAAFWSHSGIDWEEMRESFEKNLEKKRFARGGSTITMQLARNLYLTPSKNPLRKLQEILIAYRLERTLGKGRILELYLNLIEWGDGIFGAEAAARRYFGKAAADLNPDEAARLAAVLPSPLRWDPTSEQRIVLRRKNLILRRVGHEGE